MEHLDKKIVSLLHTVTSENAENNPSLTEDGALSHAHDKEPFGQTLQTFMQLEGESLVFAQRYLVDERISITMPKSFRDMPIDEQLLKYPSHHRPDFIFTNEAGTINLTFKHTESPLQIEELENFTDEMAQVVKQTQKLTEWFGHEVLEVGENRIGYCEFMTPVWNARMYNLSFFTVLEGRALMCAFNCTEEEIVSWKPVARSMLLTLKIEPERKESNSYDIN
ncbi:hypothetical protein [Paenibacillus peoriae]|uniref:hypothetical protein n=1 Tax=Paenibacillus peoriae TaxID=59893 RepID=UPI0006A6AB04|nr:hypothetical protein [Paenibacillus peoriae]ALA40561.1 hypothetical protein ABE82_03030 [Paenibacillus peoriae]OMF23837.1 hypothetical protein BK134_26525 [Paenibacillus peoriae]